MRRFSRVLPILPVLVLSTGLAAAQSPFDPNEAIVTVRAWRDVDPAAASWSQSAATHRSVSGMVAGSGFFVTATGHVLTDAALVAPVEPGVRVTRIEVVRVPAGEDAEPLVYDASLVASDPEIGTALLDVAERESPRLRFGDSEALLEGQPVTALGRGEDAEIETSLLTVRGTGQEEDSSNPGLKLGGRLEPGSEGGPVVDAEGYAVGLVRRAEEGAEALGVSIGAIKKFLAEQDLSREFPNALWLSTEERFDEKGLRLKLAERVPDLWPGRTRFDSSREEDRLSLRIDRFVSPLGLGTLEARILNGQFRDWPAATAAPRSRAERGARRTKNWLRGSARLEKNGVRYAIEYVILKVGSERIVARYELPEEEAAYNRSILRASLESLKASRLLMLPVSRPLTAKLEPARFAVRGTPPLMLPVGWRREPVTEDRPEGLPEPDEVLSTSVEADYTVAFIAHFWADGSAVDGTTREAVSGTSAVQLHGLTYGVRRTFVPSGRSLLLLECRVPKTKEPFTRDACDAWQSANAKGA